MGKERNFIIITCFLILLTTSLVTVTVKAQEKRVGKIESNYLLQLEKEYRKELKEILGDAGFAKTGITMTKILEKDSINYDIKLNNKRFKTMNAEQKMALEKKIKQLKIDGISANYYQQLL